MTCSRPGPSPHSPMRRTVDEGRSRRNVRVLPGCTVIRGELTLDTLSAAMTGTHAVVSCLASRTGAPKDAWAVDHAANSAALTAAVATFAARRGAVATDAGALAASLDAYGDLVARTERLPDGGATEARFAVEAESPNRIMLNVDRVMRTDYVISDLQPTYFVIESFADLYRQTVERDFDRLYRSLPAGFTYANSAVIDVDNVLHRGTQEYALGSGR